MTQNNLNREICGICSKQIFIGQPVIVCRQCDSIFHGRCGKKFNVTRQCQGNSYCIMCITRYEIRYNPFRNLFENDNSDKFYETEPTDLIESIEQQSKILDNCSMYDSHSFNKMVRDTNINLDTDFPTLFLNIDGNKKQF